MIQLRLRFLERIPLGTPYDEVVYRVTQVTDSNELAHRSHLIADATGVGRPVVDLLKRARPSGKLMPVVVTGGERQTREDDVYKAPKRDLIVGMQVLFQEGALRIARQLPFGETLVRELEAMEVRVSAGGREQYAAWRSGTHDDLVFAVALACWSAKEVFPRVEEHWVNRHEAEMAEVFRREMRGRE